MTDCICTTRGDGAEGCGLCNETGTKAPPARIGRDGQACPAPNLPDGYRCDGCDCERASAIPVERDPCEWAVNLPGNHFQRGAQACREMMARFVEATHPQIAQSIRLNWHPGWGADPGRPPAVVATWEPALCPAGEAARAALEAHDEPDAGDLELTARMLERWGPVVEPASPDGKVSFTRAMMDSAAVAIRRALSASPARGEGDAPVAYGAPHQPWCQPGDQPHRAFRLRFEDPDMREMVWTGPDAEAGALAAYNRYAPAWNVYLFSGHPRAHPTPATPAGWIVSNANGDRWRTWEGGFSAWTDDREKATRYARREDAEAVHAEDEDAWRIEPYGPATPAGEELRLLERFGRDTCLELSFGYDPDEEGDPGAWMVHRVNGGRSDREWTLIGKGDTPQAAILAALEPQAEGRE